VLDGAPFRFVGANRYDVASWPSGGYRCGNAYSDAQIEQLFSELQTQVGARVLRLWAFQSFTLGGSDYTTIDRAIAAARRHQLKLILTLENQWADCTRRDGEMADGSKGPAWFQSGYATDPLPGDSLPYRDYVRLTVSRYRDEPTIAMWQLLNEAQCSDGNALYVFAGDMSSVVKASDARHLVSLGTIGTGQDGTVGDAYRRLHSLATIDVVEAHDYHAETTALPSLIAGDLQTAMQLGKPFFIGEAGITAPMPPFSFSYAQRAQLMDAKIAAQWSHGAVGFLVWSFYDLGSDEGQGWDFAPSDPLAAVLSARGAQAP
jgi:endo-1,4-beta-mannosidase